MHWIVVKILEKMISAYAACTEVGNGLQNPAMSAMIMRYASQLGLSRLFAHFHPYLAIQLPKKETLVTKSV